MPCSLAFRHGSLSVRLLIAPDREEMGMEEQRDQDKKSQSLIEKEKDDVVQAKRLPSTSDRADFPFAELEERIIRAGSPVEASDWSLVRREVVEQNEDAKDRQLQRELIASRLRIQTMEVHYKWAFALLAFVVGAVLSVTGAMMMGTFMVGAGLSVFAREWVMAWIKRQKSSKGDED